MQCFKKTRKDVLGTKHAHGSDSTSDQPFPWISTKEIRIAGQPRSVFEGRRTRSHWVAVHATDWGYHCGEAAQSTTGSRLAVDGCLPCFPLLLLLLLILI